MSAELVVVLAAGQAKRMRREDRSARLSEQQQEAARKGLKVLMPVGRPFLDYVLSAAADAGFREACLVVGPQHQEIRDRYGGLSGGRLSVRFAEQPEPLGTAHALACAADVVGQRPFVLLNGDNYYPASALRLLQQQDGPATVGFELEAMRAGSNIGPERVSQLAVLVTHADGCLREVVEKPSPEFVATLPKPVLLSMNCWRFDPPIFEACRSVQPSPRGELELPDAVVYSIRHLRQRYRVLTSHAPVLDLSSRADVSAVAERLANVEVRL